MTDHLQHALAILGTVTAALASGVQGKTAKTKSDHHQELSAKEKDATLKSAHTYDANHFKTVSVWWYTFFGGAVAAVLAELIDWWGSRSLTCSTSRSCRRADDLGLGFVPLIKPPRTIRPGDSGNSSLSIHRDLI